jgi:hypothetical protein
MQSLESVQGAPGVTHFWNEQTSDVAQQTSPHASSALQHVVPAQMPPSPQGCPVEHPASTSETPPAAPADPIDPPLPEAPPVLVAVRALLPEPHDATPRRVVMLMARATESDKRVEAGDISPISLCSSSPSIYFTPPFARFSGVRS